MNVTHKVCLVFSWEKAAFCITARLQMIPFVFDIPSLPSEVLEEYRKYGLSDEEILESFSDAIDFFNSRFWCEELQGSIALSSIFQ